MRFQLISDIHLEFFKWDYVEKTILTRILPKAEHLFLCGDIGKLNTPSYKPFFDYCSANWKNSIYILGNHEFYNNSKTHKKLLESYSDFFKTYSNVHLLNDSYLYLEDYKIYGSTLWSNIRETSGLNDFHSIKIKGGHKTVPITLEYFNQLHKNSYSKLIEYLELSSDDKNIIMTHFPPLMENTSHPKYSLQDFSRKEYFANNFDVSCKVFKNVSCWISGHTHYSYNFLKDETRFVSNQLGYLKEESGYRDIIFNID
jgi:predicted phosphohydrolase